MPSPRRPSLIAVAVILAAALLALGAGRATAATPCWKQVINDWEDNGRIDGTYPLHCYRDALARLHEDVRDYTSLPDDIRAAMQAALASRKTGGTASTSSSGKQSSAAKNHVRKIQVQPSSKLFSTTLGPADTAGSVPLPLIILASLGGLLLLSAAGAAAHKKGLFGRLHLPRRPGS
ncbi:MAG: hypothetical protein WBB74_07170 [Gaiellaceae bacterium]